MKASQTLKVLSFFQAGLLQASFFFNKLLIQKINEDQSVSWVIGTFEIAACIHNLKGTLGNAKTVNLFPNDSYDHSYDYSINVKSKYLGWLYRIFYGPLLLGFLANKHSHFWYIWHTGFLIDRDYEFKFLKSKNKKIVCMFVGNDIRSPKLSLEYTRKNNIDNFINYLALENSEVFESEDARVMQTALSADLYADLIFSFKFDQISYMKSRVFPWPYMWPKEKFLEANVKFDAIKKIKIVHAPSNPVIKGTPLVRAAIKKLQLEGYDFDYVELQNLPNKVILEHLSSSHIVLNLFYGLDISLGALAIEAMANRTALIMSFDPSAIKHYDIELEGLDSCLLNTRYWQVYDHLKHLLDNPDRMKYYADNGYDFVKKHYTYEAAGEYIQNLLEENGVIN